MTEIYIVFFSVGIINLFNTSLDSNFGDIFLTKFILFQKSLEKYYINDSWDANIILSFKRIFSKLFKNIHVCTNYN